jgi:hypothetical protein
LPAPWRMNQNQEITSLDQLLDQIGEAAKTEGRVSLGSILEAVGRRSFGPLLLVAGLVTLAPVIGDIPGMPTTMALLVLLTGGQLLMRRDRFWLPAWLLNRSLARDDLCKALDWLRRPARFLDRWTRPRLSLLIRDAGLYVIAIACLAIAAVMPIMETIPFSANIAGAALTAFGLALIARDGLLALFALAFTAGTLAVVVYSL